MTDRRRHSRFAIPQGWEGQLQFFEDVVIDSWEAGEISALSIAPGCVGEELGLEVTTSGPPIVLKVRLAESRPVLIKGVVRHRLRCQIIDSSYPAVDERQIEAPALNQQKPL